MILGRKDKRRVRDLEDDLDNLINAVAVTPIRFGDESEAHYEHGERRIERSQTERLQHVYDGIVQRRLGYDPKVGPGEFYKTLVSDHLRGVR